MSERNLAIGTPWSAEEDRLLKEAVARHGDVDHWQVVAQNVPNRSNKACRKVHTVIRDICCVEFALAMASLSLSGAEKISLDGRGGQQATRVLQTLWNKVVYHCATYSWSY